MANVEFKLDTKEFNEALRRYRELSSRSEEEIVNTKAFFIARRAVVETVKADKGKIKSFFSGKQGESARIVGMIINKGRSKRGEKGLYGEAMAEAQAMMLAKRLRSIAFIKSGWIWCIKNLEKYVKSKRGAARNEAGQIKTFGKPKGKATPARRNMFTVKAIIRNFAESFHTTTKDPLGKFGGPALQKAVAFETASMEAYVQEKMRKAANDAGIKTN